MMDSKVDELLEKLNTHIVDNDKEILKCLIELDDRLKEVEVKMDKKKQTDKCSTWERGAHALCNEFTKERASKPDIYRYLTFEKGIFPISHRIFDQYFSLFIDKGILKPKTTQYGNIEYEISARFR